MPGLDDILETLDAHGKTDGPLHPYLAFEPWDVKPRPQWVKDQALKDDAGLYGDDMMASVGSDPHDFQTGYLLSHAFLRIMFAATQVGKTVTSMVEIICMATGVFPYALRFPKGVSTGIKRPITPDNVLRFGRFDADGNYIDSIWREPDAKWDCGIIEGCGVFPADKVCPPGFQMWVGTYQKPLLSRWWPSLALNQSGFVPNFFYDRTKRSEGLSTVEREICAARNISVRLITYDGANPLKRFEAASNVWSVNLDEEPPDKNIFFAAQTHAKSFLSLNETPYLGVTYTKALAFREKSKDRQVFHATLYDSPYMTPERIAKMREGMPQHEVVARVYGIHSDVRGKPWFDRPKITAWRQRYIPKYDVMRILPKEDYDGIVTVDGRDRKGLMSIGCDLAETDGKLQQDTWKIFEPKQPDVAYICAVDTAEGHDSDSETQDYSTCMIAKRDKTGKWPVPVASLRSSIPVIQFANLVLYGCRYYNNAMLCAEISGTYGGEFLSACSEYPYWYLQTTLNDKTNRVQRKRGFDMKSGQRAAIFGLMIDWVASHSACPPYLEEQLMEEMERCVVGKNGRPDHTPDFYLDMAISFGILLYVNRHSAEQIVFNGARRQKEKYFIQSLLEKEEHATNFSSRRIGALR